MKNITLALSAAALALAGGAVYAAAPMMMGKDMTRAEATTMANEMWTKLDVNKDGVVNQADRDAKRAERFDRMDGNKDGSISRDEFAAGHPGRGGMRGDHAGMGGPEGGPMAGGMEMGGGKHGGKHGGRHGGHHGGGGMGKMMLHMADANKDGSVTRAEFDGAVAQHFAQVDTNGDGTIVKAEREAAHAAMKARMEAMRAAAPAGQ